MRHTAIDQSFRQHYAELVATLCRIFGFRHIELLEDCVQTALLKAVDVWPTNGQPANPSGWLFRVAHNEALMKLRSSGKRRDLLKANFPDNPGIAADAEHPRLRDEVDDDLLRMIFVVCNPDIPPPSQIAIALKVLCGLGVEEIASHLFTSEESVYKRIQRARRVLAQTDGELAELTPDGIRLRIGMVRKVLYALFTEGHLSTNKHEALNVELCDEAIRLAKLLAEHRLCNDPETLAFVALMQFHRARMSARQGFGGSLLLLEEQDRSLWDQELIAKGMKNLAQSAAGNAFTRYHAEAAIAAEHCLAPSFAETRWKNIADNYRRLEKLSPSLLHRLNRAVAVAECSGPKAALALLDGLHPPTWLEGHYLWSAVISDLHFRCGNIEAAREHRDLAFSLAPNENVRNALAKRLELSR